MADDGPTKPSSPESNARLLRVLEGVTARRMAGEDVTDESVMAANPSLMPELKSKLEALRDAEHARKGERRVWLPGAGEFVPIPVYDGHGLLPANRLAGPAIVEQQNTTLFVAEEFDVVTDAYGTFVVYARERAEALPEGLL